MATYNITQRSDGEVISADKYNADHQNHANNNIPESIEDVSSTVDEMKQQVDPGDTGSESLAIDLKGEITRLRFEIANMKQRTEWYNKFFSNLRLDDRAAESLSDPVGGPDEACIFSKNTDGRPELQFISGQNPALALTGLGRVLVPQGLLGGLRTQNWTDTDHDIKIDGGICADSTAQFNLVIPEAGIVKQIDADWAPGNDAGGIVQLPTKVDTWYHVFLILNPTTGVVDAIFNDDINNGNLPAGFTKWRRIASVLTDVSANITPYFQTGNVFNWRSPFLEIDEAPPSTDAQLKTLSRVPKDVPVIANFNAFFDASNSDCYFSSPFVNDEAPSSTVAPLSTIRAQGGADQSGQFNIQTDSTQQIRYRVSSTGGATIRLASVGYIDGRGEND